MQGLGKRVLISSFRQAGRIGKGVRAVRLAADDALASAILVGAKDQSGVDAGTDVLISTANGMLLRVAVQNVALLSRVAKGYRVVKVKDGDEVGTVTLIGD